MIGGVCVAAVPVAWHRFRQQRDRRWKARRVIETDDHAVEKLRDFLLKAGIPEHEVRNTEEVQGWLAHDERGRRGSRKSMFRSESARRSAGRHDSFEYFVVADRYVEQERVMGAALWATVFPLRKTMFISYFAKCKKQCRTRDGAVDCLCDKINRDFRSGALKGVQKVIFEIEDPRPAQAVGMPMRESRDRARAKHKKFSEMLTRAGFPCYLVDVDYVQPSLDIERRVHEEPMGLMIANRAWQDRSPTQLTGAQVQQLLRFVYNGYADAFLPDDDEEESMMDQKRDRYRRYLYSLLKRVHPDPGSGARLLSPSPKRPKQPR